MRNFYVNKIQCYREGNRLEVKKAADKLPNSIWETYSAFANTDGGVILLGISEFDDKSFEITGVNDTNRIVADFWNTVNNLEKVSYNILTDKCIEIKNIDGKDIIIIDVPRAERSQKPVYLGKDPFKGSYRRNGEGDYHCTQNQVAAMFRDANEKSADKRVLTNMDMTVFDMNSVKSYRNVFASFHPNHVWLKSDIELFLHKIGAMAKSDDDQKYHPTVAGLLMFGYEYEIVRECPEYFLDYREKMDDSARWTDRIISSSGEWSGNLFDFFFMVFPKLVNGLPRPFRLEKSSRIDETPLHDALREWLLNALVHADHYGRQGIVIIKTANSYSFSNPGDMRTGLEVALSGGISDPRNSTIMKMFGLIDKGERAGQGIPDSIGNWQLLTNVKPEYSVSYNPERTTVSIVGLEDYSPSDNIVVTGDYTSKSRSKSGSKSGSKSRSKTELIIEYCSEPRSLKEISEHFGMKDRYRFKKKYITPLLGDILEMTEPDSPNSPTQKYVTVTKK